MSGEGADEGARPSLHQVKVQDLNEGADEGTPRPSLGHFGPCACGGQGRDPSQERACTIKVWKMKAVMHMIALSRSSTKAAGGGGFFQKTIAKHRKNQALGPARRGRRRFGLL